MKKAFLVGIDDYAPAGPGGPDLHGCVADAKDMANTLVIYGFNAAPANMRLCTDARATKTGILSGLDWLVSGATEGDSLVFYYSGHGSQVPDVHGDEVDRKDEILCPHDIDFQKGTYITDDDLRTMFAKVPSGVNLEVIIDACHSGTITRAFGPDADMVGVAETAVPGIRYLPPPVDLMIYTDYKPDLATTRIMRPHQVEVAREVQLVPGLNHTLWAACRDYQVSEEVPIGGVVRGAFTYNFCQVLRRATSGTPRKKIDGLVSAALKRSGFAQIPQLETSRTELMEKPFV